MVEWCCKACHAAVATKAGGIVMKKGVVCLFSFFLLIQPAFAEYIQHERIYSSFQPGARTRVIQLKNLSIDYIQVTWKDGRNKRAKGQLYAGDSLQDERTVFNKHGWPEEVADYSLSQIPPMWDTFPRAPLKYLQVGIEEEAAYIYALEIVYLE